MIFPNHQTKLRKVAETVGVSYRKTISFLHDKNEKPVDMFGAAIAHDG